MKRDIIIDADHVLFLVTNSKTYKSGFSGEIEGDDNWGTPITPNLEAYKEHFRSIIREYELIAEVESICYNWKVGKTKVIFTDHTNFRYKIYPDYKAGRLDKEGVIVDLKKWGMKEYMYVPNTEADDVVAHYVRKGGLGFTTDKDLLKGVEGIWYNSHYQHNSWNRTTKEDAERFFKCQVLAGDRVDGIPSIAGVGLLTAEKLLNDYGDTWEDIERIFVDKGYDRQYMLTMARLVSMTQWSPKKGIKLWKIPKKSS